jgi:hypothetical protein
MGPHTVHLVDPHTGTVLCRLFPQDKAANASGLRRGVQSITAEPVTPPRGIGPLLARMIDRQVATSCHLPTSQGRRRRCVNNKMLALYGLKWNPFTPNVP